MMDICEFIDVYGVDIVYDVYFVEGMFCGVV